MTGRQRALIAAAACAVLARPVAAADGVWINASADSNWSIPSNWADGVVADGVDAIADFTVDLASPRVVTLDTSRTVGTLLFEVVGTNAWTLDGASALTLATSSGAPRIDVGPSFSAGLTISTPLSGTAGFEKTGASSLILNSANSLSGVITVSAGSMHAQNVGAFGTSSLVINGGMVSLNDTAAFNTPITIGNGASLQANPSSGSSVTLTPALTLSGTALVGAVNGKTLILSGGTSGAGQLEIRSPQFPQFTQTTTINGPIAHNGGLVMAVGTTNLAAANTYTGATAITGGTVNLDHASALPAGTALSISGGSSTLNVNHSNTAASLSIAGGTIAGAGTLTASGQFAVNTAAPVTLNATLAGITSISKTGYHADATFSNIGSALGATLDIQQGRVRVTGVNGLGSSAGGTTVSGSSNAVLDFNASGQTFGDAINLNNASGFAFNGGLTTTQGTTLTGALNLGNGGSFIGGSNSLTIAGPISGGSLTKVGTSLLRLSGSANSYIGATTIGLNGAGGTLSVIGASAHLDATSGITVNRGGTFAIERFDAGAGDHVADSIPFTLNGGTVRFDGRQADFTDTETIGNVTAAMGHNIVGVEPLVGTNEVYLTVSSLARQRGAAVTFRSSQTIGATAQQIHINGLTAGNLDDGIVGGWATVFNSSSFTSDFAGYDFADPRGVIDLDDTGRAKQLDAGVSTDNIILSMAQSPLSANRNVKSARIDSGAGSVNLGGFSLNVESGGVLMTGTGTTSISSGTLTAGGSTANKELFLIANGGTRTIDAAIADNPGGAVSLVVSAGASSSAIVALSGVNSYTGTTYVNASSSATTTLRIDALSAVPGNGNLEVNGGTWSLQASGAAVDLGSVTLRHGGAILGAANPAPIDADSYAVESGTISLRMQGSGAMTKTTDGTVTIAADNSTAGGGYTGYSGAVTVSGGILAIGNGAAALQSAGAGPITVNAAGRLALNNSTPLVNNISLAGGELAAVGAARIFAGAISVTANSRILNIDGIGTAAAPGVSRDLTLSGPLNISTNVTLEKLGAGVLNINGNGVGQSGSTLSVTAGTLNVSATQSIGRVVGAGSVNVNGTLTTLAGGGVSRVASVTTGASGRLDLHDNKLILTNQSLSAVSSQIASARNGGEWNGNGITSSQAAAQNLLTTLAVATAGSISKTSFGGHSVSASDVLVMYTYTGDADLSGVIDGDDFARIDAGYSASLTGYASGDFDYSGTIDADDYWLIDRNYGRQTTPFPATAAVDGVAAVPEPVSLAPIVLAAALANRRRRRGQRCRDLR